METGESARLVQGGREDESVATGTEHSVANHARVGGDKLSVSDIESAVLHESAAWQDVVGGGPRGHEHSEGGVMGQDPRPSVRCH